MEISQIEKLVDGKQKKIDQIRKEIAKEVVGQEDMVNGILIGLFSNGHILLEGVPGLAKSLTVNTVSKVLGVGFKRIQFTPDLLPADLIGTEIYNQKTGDFIIKKGPIFSNIILADEINRAPAKVQSALLESMQERQITIGDTTYKLDAPFLVLATQNPLEQEGTYPLPEAQQDRFMLKLKIDYPKREEEKMIVDMLTKASDIEKVEVENVLQDNEIFEIRDIVGKIYVDDKLKDYVLDIIFKSREKNEYIIAGASPRASINLIKAAKGRAFLENRAYVVPDDIKAVVYEVLRHRIILSYEAEAEDLTVEDIIESLLDKVNLP